MTHAAQILLAAYYVSQDLILVSQMLYYRGASHAHKSGNDTERDALLPRSRSRSPSPSAGRSARVTAVLQNTALAIFVVSVGVLGTILDDTTGTDDEDTPWILSAQVMGYLSMILYRASRMSQPYVRLTRVQCLRACRRYSRIGSPTAKDWRQACSFSAPSQTARISPAS